MKLLVVSDAHIFRTPDGNHWARSIYSYSFWSRYLDVFDEVRVVARVKDIYKIDSKALLVNGKNVEIYGIPFFQGPRELLRKYFNIQKVLKGVDQGCDCVLLRMPSQTAAMTWMHIRRDIPLAGEIVYDMMDDVNRPGQSLLMKLLNIIISNNLRKFCLKANGVSYVTEYTIQKHYPSYARLYGESSNHFEASYSTITLHNNAFTSPRDFSNCSGLTLVLSSVSMNSERKGEKILIEVVKKCRDKGYNVKAIIIGDGKFRSLFEQYAKNLDVHEFVEFTGLLPSSDDVRIIMQRADMFVFPSQGEGLPRGVLEAMAIGMPVLSSPVGGIPEIINKDYLFNPTDSDSFATKVCSLIDNPEELTCMSEENYKKALNFKNDILQSKRVDFYKKLRKLCELK